jgi:Calcineurin-like phosphoesterase
MRFIPALGLAVTLLFHGDLAGASGPHKVERDWAKYPPVVQIDTREDIFVVGDVHGDYDHLVRVLRAANIIGRQPGRANDVNWIAGKAVVVFIGDMIDKGTESLKVLLFVRALREAAIHQGGQVIVLLGNHEARFLADPGNEKARNFVKELREANIDAAEVAACHGDLGQFLCSLPFAARVRDWFFAHAGDTNGRNIDALAAEIRKGVDRDGFGSPQVVGKGSILEADLARKAGSRPWLEPEGRTRSERQVLADYTSALGVTHIVQGHEPGKIVFADGTSRKSGEMFQRYGILFLADTGMSKGVGKSEGAVLRIKEDNGQEAVAICADGTKTTIWDERHKQAIGQAAACGK